MKKFFAFIKGIFSSGTGKIVLDVGASTATAKLGEVLEKGLIDFYAKKPLACKQLVSSLYVFADTSLEDLADKTETKYDDNAVDEVKKEMEEFAAAHGFELSNLDAD